MASGTPTMDNAGNAGTLQRNYGSGGSARDYDGLKQQCDKAMSELTLLRRQHSDTARRCDHAMKELDYYRGQHRAAMNQLEASAQESAALRNKYAEIAGEKQRLERDVQELRQQLSDIHCHQGEDYSNQDNANADTGGFLVTRSSSRRQPSETDSYEALRKRYEELLSAHSAAVSKLEIAQDEVARLNKQCDELTEEINNAVRERNGLKQKCTAAIRQWDIALHERNEYRDALGAAQAQREEAVQELSQAMAVRMKASKDIKRLTDERNSAIQEYALIMSERDTVHKEMEKLSDDLTQALEKTKTLETENKQLTEDKQALSYQMETLRREIASALHDRDKALKECNDLREKFGGYTLQLSHDHNSRDLLKSRLEFVGTHPGENATRKEVVHDSRSLTQGDRRPDTLDQATQEIESLRKALDEIRSELTEATQEAEVSKRRRDWAFSERDKIVLERESIRTLCDRLRKERDRAVSELAAALRDSDEIKKQRNEACRELARLKDTVESRQETQHHRQQFRNNSRDSAIDADMQEWETEILDMDLSGLASDSSLGLELAGGSDDPQRPNDTGIYVAAIAPGSIADGKLKVNDCIARVNHLDCGRVSRRMVLEAVRASLPRAHLVVRRRRQGNTPRRMLEGIRTTQLAALHHGLTLETGVYVSKINPGSLAAKEGTISIGDRVLGINNKSMEGLKNIQEAMTILNDDRCDIITITTLSSNLSLNSDDSSFPTKDGHHHHHHKMVNRCSQTEDLTTKHYSDNDFIDRRYLVPSTIGHGSVYKVSKTTGGSSSSEKNNTGGTWDIIREKIDLVRGRKHSKDKEDKKKYRNSSPSHDQEQDAIAELDSVIESYHRKSSSSGGNNSSNIPGVLKRSKRRGKELTVQEKNGGTWPKARSQNILQNPTGTIINTRKKERAPISMFLTDSSPIPTTKHCCDRNSNPISVENNLNRHVAYKSMDNHQNFDQDNRLSTILHSDNSIDYSLKPPGGPGGMEKEFLDYYIKKNSGKPSGVGRNKYTTSDSDSNAGPDSLSSVAGGGSNIRPHSQLYPIGVPRYPPFYPHPHPHPHIPRLPSSQSGESFCFEPPTHHWHHAHSPSEGGGVIIPWQHRTATTGSTPVSGNVPPPPIESGTFPRKRENQRFRIPSNPSVAGSIERTSERASPMPTFHVEVLSGGRGRKTHDYSSWNHHRPEPGELRRVHIDKSQEPLGIQIQCLDSGGVFVSTVSEHSLASQVGLQIGDQLLEVCGINMRSATYQLAANVLRQCGNSITMLVQYSPEKYHELDGTASGTSSDEDDDPDNDHDEHGGDDHGDHHEPDRDHDADGDEEEEEATPRNTPRPQRKPSNGDSTLTRSQISHAVSTLQRHKVSVRNPTEEPPIKQSQNLHEPRFLFIETRKCSNLGISLVGGNAVGIFVHSVQPDSLAHNAGLRTGDQILEYNNVDLRHATAEEAAYELAKPADKVSVLAHYNLDRYNEIKDKPGDSLYVRCGFDRGLSDTGSSGTDGGLHLRFNKDDVLYVDNTMFNGVPGNWRAWRLDSEGRRHQCGIIPSKYKVEEELLLRRSLGDLEGRGSTTARRSFFRRKKNTRGGSGPSNRDSKELASFSNHTLGWYSDSGTLHEDNALCSYQRVERLDYPVYRPVLILGPLADGVADKLVTDFPDRFKRCTPEIRHCPQSALDQELADNLIIDFRRKGNYFECSTVNAIKSICDKNCHCILDISVTSVERLHRHQIYPIVLLIKFKSTKQIKEVKDTRYPLDKVSAKAAKEMYEHGLKLEAEYRHRISAVIPAGVNIAYMCTQVKAAVDAEQNKSLWVPFHGI